MAKNCQKMAIFGHFWQKLRILTIYFRPFLAHCAVLLKTTKNKEISRGESMVFCKKKISILLTEVVQVVRQKGKRFCFYPNTIKTLV